MEIFSELKFLCEQFDRILGDIPTKITLSSSTFERIFNEKPSHNTRYVYQFDNRQIEIYGQLEENQSE